jgi:hypothetical protein
MKKLVILMIALTFFAGVSLMGCSQQEPAKPAPKEEAKPAEAPKPAEPAKDEAAKPAEAPKPDAAKPAEPAKPAAK